LTQILFDAFYYAPAATPGYVLHTPGGTFGSLADIHETAAAHATLFGSPSASCDKPDRYDTASSFWNSFAPVGTDGPNNNSVFS